LNIPPLFANAATAFRMGVDNDSINFMSTIFVSPYYGFLTRKVL